MAAKAGSIDTGVKESSATLVFKDLTPAVADALHVSDLISISKFIQKWETMLPKRELMLTEGENLPYSAAVEKFERSDSEEFIPSNILEELFIVCNPLESLYPSGFKPNTVPDLDSIPPDAKELHSVKNNVEHERRLKVDRNYKTYTHCNMKHGIKEDEFLAHKSAGATAEGKYRRKHADKGKQAKNKRYQPPVIAAPEVLIALSVMKPSTSHSTRGRPLIMMHVIGTTTLAEIRDAIHCIRDWDIPGDFSFQPDLSKVSMVSRDIFSSSMIYIEDVFYIDTRPQNHIDYSSDIIAWLRSKGDTKEYVKREMDKVQLKELSIRLGQPYVYIHQGNCEHIMQFTDIRLLHEHDCQYANAYPIKILANAPKGIICNGCQSRYVKWLVRNSVLSPSDPCHYCDICLKMFHYNKDSTKICDFQAFAYADPPPPVKMYP